ncbi:hypothetical protein LMG26411_02540 [Cupriavidus numazuensis]|uniref:Uncharacterized protein n=1 Tax=Cupriavidus numazuensis TaxID=221992 RepID=A0ABN7Q3R0_9BURK|nr:hypothetical protein LMG26411_02540 [Cupriavidus numazuensis]
MLLNSRLEKFHDGTLLAVGIPRYIRQQRIQLDANPA